MQCDVTVDSERSAMKCPTCRRHVDIPKGGVDHLPRNLFVKNLQEVLTVKNDTECKCEYCVALGENDSIATWRCVDCCHSLCDQCKYAHIRTHILSKPHTIMNIYEWKCSDVATICHQNKEACRRHVDKTLEYYCNRCKLTICQNCHTLEHADHECKDIHEVAQQTRPVIQNSIKITEGLIEQKEDKIRDMTKCREFLMSTEADELRVIREHRSTCLRLMSKCFDDFEKKAVEISRKSRKTIDVDLNTLKADVSILQTSNKIGKAVQSFGRAAETIETSQRLSDLLKSQEDSKVIDIDTMKRSLFFMQFKANELAMAGGGSIFGFCEKQPLFPDLITETQDNDDCQLSTEVDRRESNKTISRLSKLLNAFNTGRKCALSIAVTSSNLVVTGHDDRVSLYDQEGDKLHDFKPPPEITQWSPWRVNITNNDDKPLALVVNCCGIGAGGGVYIYTEVGHYTGTRVRLNNPRDAVLLDSTRLAVLLCSEDTWSGWLEFYNTETGELIVNTINKMGRAASQLHSCKVPLSPVISQGHISARPTSRDVIVSHDSSVTAFSLVDLKPRLLFKHGRSRERKTTALCDVCVDRKGRVFIADVDMTRVFVLSEGRGEVSELDLSRVMRDGPYGLTVTTDGHLMMTGKGIDGIWSVFLIEYLGK